MPHDLTPGHIDDVWTRLADIDAERRRCSLREHKAAARYTPAPSIPIMPTLTVDNYRAARLHTWGAVHLQCGMTRQVLLPVSTPAPLSPNLRECRTDWRGVGNVGGGR